MHLMIIQPHILYSEKVVKNQRPKFKIKWPKIKKIKKLEKSVKGFVYLFFRILLFL